jgi:hypothetical protein
MFHPDPKVQDPLEVSNACQIWGMGEKCQIPIIPHLFSFAKLTGGSWPNVCHHSSLVNLVTSTGYLSLAV